MPSVRRAFSAIACAVALAAIPAAPGVARAQPSQQDLADARRTFNEGKDLEKAGNYAAALERFKKVAEVRITPQVRFHIALCEENLGKLVSALKGFELAGEEARQAGSSAIEVSENAPTRADALRKRVAHLKIQVNGRLTTSKLTLDGAVVVKETIGADQLVDPGKHRVMLETDGAAVFDKDIELKEQGNETVVVDAHDADPAEGGPIVGSGGDRPIQQAPPSRAPAYVFGAIGVAGIAAGGVFMGLSQVAKNDVLAKCHSGMNCPQSLESEGDRGKTFYTTSFIAGGVGAAALAAGVVMFVVLTPKKAKAASGATTLLVAPALGGASVSGRF
jgi:hypothetical protein